MSVNTLSRLLEVVAKSIKHTVARSRILAIELFQAQRDAAIASSKILLDHSSYALRNAPINSQAYCGKVYNLGHRVILGSTWCSYSLLEVLLDHSSHALRNAPINSQLLFDNKIKEVAKSNV